MNTNISPNIPDAQAFIAEQYALLSPNWNSLSGKEQLAILQQKIPVQHMSVTLAPDAKPGDAIEKSASAMLVQYYIFAQSNYNSEVGALLGIKEIFTDV